VSVGQNVTKGQVIAYEGSTGASTGPHVHFMVLDNNRWVDPLNYVQLP
jgi:murein DD-endopeptidase MepM/ murein hydrolase activator NlpD